MGLRGPKPRPIEERYWENVEFRATSKCWRWLGTIRPDGRPQIGEGGKYGKTKTAFRIGYELAFGPIPEGMDLDHLCNNSWCVNPNHCWPVTPKENRGRREREKTHCPQGHEYNEKNTYYRADGHRQCRVCANDRRKAYLAEKAVAEGRIPGVRGYPWYLRKENL